MISMRLLSPRMAAAALAAWLVALGLAWPSAVPAQTRSAARSARPDAVTLNFVNADIEGVARAMGAILKRQFVVDPRVRGNITLFSEEPLTPAEAYRNFLAALRGLGFAVVEVSGLYKIVPEADAKLQTGTVSVGADVARRGDQVATQIFRLAYENANNLVPVLRPLITPNNTINANPSNNTLVITDYADNLERLGKIIAAMDTPTSGDIEIIPLKYAVATDIAVLAQRLAEGGPVIPGAPGAAPVAAGTSGTSVVADPRSNALIVRAPNPARMATIRALIARLDQPLDAAGANGNVWVVHLKNAEATRLAQVLRAAFAGAPGTGGLGAGGGGGGGALTNTSLTQAAPPPAVTSGTGSAGASPQAASPVSPSAAPSTGGFIQADPATNSLIITAPEPLYRQVRAMIDQLDSRRAQIYIESMIVEVTGDNAANFGFQWQGLLGQRGDNTGVVAGTNFGTTGNLLNIDQAQIGGGSGSGGSTNPSTLTLNEGLNVGIIRRFAGRYGLAAIANVLQSLSNTNIVSTPNLITLDNEEAKIIIGSNVPFITGQFTNTGTATTSPFQTIERKDVGITLRIRPQIGEGGTVRMQIFQEQSSLSTQVAPGTSNAGPSTDKRSIESTVVVDDGAILVLGGLVQDKYTDTNSKIPLLGDIPWIGALFRNETRQRTRTNLMVFLRPVVMRDADAATRISLDRYDLIRAAQQQEMQPASSVVVPINESPVIPPSRTLQEGASSTLLPPAPGGYRDAPASAPSPSTPPTRAPVRLNPSQAGS
jgi:general secretion pathway protein D